MATSMTTMQKKSTNSPDETRTFPKGKMDLTRFDTVTIGRGTFEPGWKWSESVKPIAGTDSCQAPHTMYIISGRMHIVMDDGTENEIGAGDTVVIPPGHDAWTVGDEDCVGIDFTGAADYAKR